MFKDLINFEKLEDEMECWQTLSKQSTILEICKKMKSKKIETQLQKVRTIKNNIYIVVALSNEQCIVLLILEEARRIPFTK